MKALKGKTALVTGASGGIGRAIVLRLARAGASVAVHYGGNEARARAVVEEIAGEGGQAFAVRADVREPRAIATMFETLAARDGGGLDILVNNAGIGLSRRVADTSEEDFDRVLATNVKGPFFVSQAALPYLRDGGAVLNVSSVVSIAAYPVCTAYALSKAALNSFTRSLAADLAGRRIRVNAIAPGATATEFLGQILNDTERRSRLENAAAFGRLGESDEIASVAEFLVSPGSAWMTGQIVQVSGGMHL